MADMKKLFDEFDEEIEGVIGYSKEALEAKDDPSISKMYAEMAKQELQHAQNIQSIIFKEAEKAKDEDPADILARIWADKKADMAQDLVKAKMFLSSVG